MYKTLNFTGFCLKTLNKNLYVINTYLIPLIEKLITEFKSKINISENLK